MPAARSFEQLKGDLSHAYPGLSPQLDQQYTTMTVACLIGCMAIWFLFTKRGEALCLAPEGPEEIWPTIPDAPGDDRAARKKKKRGK